MYNLSKILVLTKSVQTVRNLSNEQKSTEYPFFLRRNRPYPLWWNLPNPTLLQISRYQKAPSTIYSSLSEKQPLFNFRFTPGNYLYHSCRFRTSQQRQDITIQRIVSKHRWIKIFSQCNDLTPFPSASNPQEPSTTTRGSRLFSPKGASISTFTYQCGIRFRYHHSNRIWQVGKGRYRLQSIQAWPCFLSSLTLLRSPYSGLYTRRISSRRRAHRLREEEVHKGILGQITFLYLPDKDSWRFQVVRPQNPPFPRREESRLCHRSQSQSAYTTYHRWASLSRVQEGLGGSRIPVSTPPIYASPLYRGAKACTRERRWPAYALYLKKACLPCGSYKSRPTSGERVEVLSRPSQDRTEYQRTKVGLLSFQDTHKKIFGKPNLFPFTSIYLQYRKLVQKAMFTKAISIRHITDYSQRISSIAGKISKIWKQKLTPLASTLCLQLGV